MNRNILTDEERATLAEQWESESVQPIFDPPRYIAEMRAEIDRLRERLREAAKLNMELMEIRRSNEAEIERLRKSLDDHLESEAAETRRADRERDRARTAEAEIERLRYDLGLERHSNERLRGLSDITRLDVMWQELVRERYAAENNAAVLAAEVQSLRSEIERLRGELAMATERSGGCY